MAAQVSEEVEVGPDSQRWRSHPVRSALIRVFAFVLPIAASIVFVHFASAVVAVPTSSFGWFASWWVLMSGTATVVLVVFDRLTRRLLPLAALYKVSLVFPDRAPSRFRAAIGTNTTLTLEERIAKARAAGHDATPVEAAEQLLDLVAQLNVHDKLTRGHSERVRAYARMIGEELRLSKQRLDLLNWAALLHDVGKLAVPTEILTKPGRPTGEEWTILRKHPLFGEEMVAPLRSWLGEWADAVGDHHERWDGTGYPRGKAGSEIAFAGRIVAVADAYDVITSARSYKSAFSAGKGRDEIARCAGMQFDPRIVRAFLSIGLGRLRLAMGPLSWLAHAPILGRLPLTPAIGSAGAAMLTVAGATAGGIVAGPAASGAAAAIPLPAQHRNHVAAPSVERIIHEDGKIIVRLPGVTDTRAVRSVRILQPPAVGRATVLANGAIRYISAPNFSGTVTIGYEACAGDANCARGTVHIVVEPVNDAPHANNDTARTSQATPILIHVLANDSDPEGDTLQLAAVSRPHEGSAKITGRAVRFTPPRHFTGPATFSYTVGDSHGGNGRAHVRVLVRRHPTKNATPPTTIDQLSAPKAPPVHRPDQSQADTPAAPETINHAPHAADDAVSLPKGSTVLLAVLANDSDPDGDALSLASISAPGHGAADRNGNRIQYTAPTDYDGSVTLTYRLTDSHGASDNGHVAITILPVNRPPSFVAGPNQMVAEDSGAHSSAGWATDISAGPPNEASQSVSFLTSNDQPTLFTNDGQPTVAADGTLTFTSAADANGTATVTVTAIDDGGTAKGGINTSATRTITITVDPVNDAPTFTSGADPVVLEDAGPQTITGWASGIRPGPPDEASQAVTFAAMNSNNLLFTAGGQPAVAANGTLTFTPAANASGIATVTLEAVDTGGTANGGSDTSPTSSITISVTAQPDPPFAANDTVSVNEDDPAGVTFDVLANDSDPDGDPLLLSAYDATAVTSGQLTQNSGGNFTYIPGPGFSGWETFTYTVADGTGATATGTATITTIPQPDSPVAGADAYTTAQATPLTIAAPGLLNNDYDEDSDPITVNPSLALGPANGLAFVSADGSFVYTPNPLFVGTDSFTYQISDGTGRSATGTATITVSSTVTSSILYLQPTGPTVDLWDITAATPPATSPVPDTDADGDPGLTIKHGDGKETITDGEKYQLWRYVLPGPLQLDGPVTLQLWSTVKDFQTGKDAHPYVYLYDCAAGGTPCTKIGETEIHYKNWNGTTANWVYHEITIGSVSRTMSSGRELRIRLLVNHNDLWIPLTTSYPSSLVITTG